MTAVSVEVHNRRRLFLQHLESDWYKQGQGYLRNKDDEFCCLGVACNVHAILNPEVAATQTNPLEYQRCSGFPKPEVLQFFGIGHALGEQMYVWNDSDNFTFKEIAAKLRELWHMPAGKFIPRNQ
jgi:hypothetical protein